nr:retrovirus-related Pol polyprotein from transposon TNT 1-94 [Tanacetum cinerariifolium]
MNFTLYHMDVKSAFLNKKLKEEIYVQQPLGFESSEFLNHVYKLDKALYGLKQAPRACENSNGTPNNLGPDLNGKAVNETQYKGMIGSLMYLTTSRPDIQFLTCLCARYQANPKESHLIDVKRIFRYLKDVQNTDPLSSPTEDTSAPNVVSIIQTVTSSSVTSMATLAPQDRWSRDKHIDLVNIVGNPRAGMLTRVMAKELGAA